MLSNAGDCRVLQKKINTVIRELQCLLDATAISSHDAKDDFATALTEVSDAAFECQEKLETASRKMWEALK